MDELINAAQSEAWGKETPYMAAWIKAQIETTSQYQDMQIYEADKENIDSKEREYLEAETFYSFNPGLRPISKHTKDSDPTYTADRLKMALQYNLEIERAKTETKKKLEKESAFRTTAPKDYGNYKSSITGIPSEQAGEVENIINGYNNETKKKNK